MQKSWKKGSVRLLGTVLSASMMAACVVPSYAATIQISRIIPNQSSTGQRVVAQQANNAQRTPSQNQTVRTNNTQQPRQAVQPQQTQQPTVSRAQAEAEANEAESRNTSGAKTIKVMISGIYNPVDADAILDRVNEIRQEAADEGLVEQYVTLKWSTDMEAIARQRSVEGILCASHNRPNGDSCFTAESSGYSSDAENIDWGKSALNSIEKWYSEKELFAEDQNPNHGSNYYNLINPAHNCIGVSSYSIGEGTVKSCVTAQLSKEANLSEDVTYASGTSTDIVEVEKSDLTLRLNGPSSLTAGKKMRFEAIGSYACSDDQAYNGTFTVNFTTNPEWKSSDESVATINESGTVTAVAPGTASITATLYGKTVGKTLTVK